MITLEDPSRLVRALTDVKPAISNKPIAPVAQCVRITADEHGLRVEAFDGEIAIATCDTSAEHDDATIVTAHGPLLAALRAVKGSVTLEHSGTQLVLKSGRFRSRLLTVSADDWRGPSEPREPLPTRDVTSDEIRALVESVGYAASADETRYNLNGICFDAENGAAVATDGHRLAKIDFACGDASATIPRSVLPSLSALAGLADSVSLGLGGSPERVECYAESEDYSVSVRAPLIGGQFPAWQQVLPPADAPVLATVVRADLLTALDAVGALADATAPVRLEPDRDDLTLTVNDPERGECTAVVERVGHANAEPTAFNLRYLRDAVKRMDADTIVIQQAGPLAPCRIEPPTPTGQIAVVMPVRL